ncbi:MAG: methyltransferase FkbM family [uncultured bacterium]|nr:MAG: methyltransferase FkbM family [uncultured bacterium]
MIIINYVRFIIRCSMLAEFTFRTSIVIIWQHILNKRIIYFNYKHYKLCINNDSWSSVSYHILNSVKKVEKLVDQIAYCSVAVDAGANNGWFSYFIKIKFPESTVYVIEPSESLQEVIKMNLANFTKCEIYKTAISNINSDIEMYINKKSQQTNAVSIEMLLGGSNLKKLTKDIIKEKVSCTTLDQLFQYKKMPDVLKVDIQGEEYNLLLGATTVMPNVNISFFEITLLDSKVFETVLLLKKYYRFNKVINEIKMGADVMFYNNADILSS